MKKPRDNGFWDEKLAELRTKKSAVLQPIPKPFEQESVKSHPLFADRDARIEARRDRLSKRAQDLADIFSQANGAALLEKSQKLPDLIKTAVDEARNMIDQFDFPIRPTLEYEKVKNVKSAGSSDDILSGTVVLLCKCATLTGTKQSFEIPVTIKGGRVVPPSVINFQGKDFVLAQSTVNAIVQRASSYELMPVRNMFDPPQTRDERATVSKTRNEIGYQPREGIGPISVCRRQYSKTAGLTNADKKVLDAFSEHQPAEGKWLSTDGQVLEKMGLGGEQVAYWEDDYVYVTSTESVKSDESILRGLMNVIPKNWLKFSYERGDYGTFGDEPEEETPEDTASEPKDEFNHWAKKAQEEDDLLRDVDIEGYRLKMWDAGEKYERGQRRNYVRYEFSDPSGKVIFSGDDYSPSPMQAIDSDEAVRGLLSFLTLKPGDTDDEYFEKYTDEQRDFADTAAEGLSLWGMDPQEDDEDDYYHTFKDWEDKGPREASRTASMGTAVPPGYAKCKELMDKAQEEGLDTFPRSWIHVLRNYILEVVGTYSQDQWMTHLVNDGYVINPYGGNRGRDKTAARGVSLESWDEPVLGEDGLIYGDSEVGFLLQQYSHDLNKDAYAVGVEWYQDRGATREDVSSAVGGLDEEDEYSGGLSQVQQRVLADLKTYLKKALSTEETNRDKTAQAASREYPYEELADRITEGRPENLHYFEEALYDVAAMFGRPNADHENPLVSFATKFVDKQVISEDLIDRVVAFLDEVAAWVREDTKDEELNGKVLWLKNKLDGALGEWYETEAFKKQREWEQGLDNGGDKTAQVDDMPEDHKLPEHEDMDEVADEEPLMYEGTKTPIEIGDSIRFEGKDAPIRGTIIEIDQELHKVIVKSKGMEYRVEIDDITPMNQTFKKMYSSLILKVAPPGRRGAELVNLFMNQPQVDNPWDKAWDAYQNDPHSGPRDEDPKKFEGMNAPGVEDETKTAESKRLFDGKRAQETTYGGPYFMGQPTEYTTYPQKEKDSNDLGPNPILHFAKEIKEWAAQNGIKLPGKDGALDSSTVMKWSLSPYDRYNDSDYVEAWYHDGVVEVTHLKINEAGDREELEKGEIPVGKTAQMFDPPYEPEEGEQTFSDDPREDELIKDYLSRAKSEKAAGGKVTFDPSGNVHIQLSDGSVYNLADYEFDRWLSEEPEWVRSQPDWVRLDILLAQAQGY